MSLFKTELPPTVAADQMIFFLEEQCANKRVRRDFGQFVLRAMYSDKEIAENNIPARNCFVTLQDQETSINTKNNRLAKGYAMTVSAERQLMGSLRGLDLKRNVCFLAVHKQKIVDVGVVQLLDS